MNLIVSDVDINGQSSIIMITSCIIVVYFVAKGVARCFRLQHRISKKSSVTGTFE